MANGICRIILSQILLWPDFRKAHFYEAIIEYQNRERRFGKTSEQITRQE